MSRARGGANWWRPALAIVAPVLISTTAAVTVLIRVLAPGNAQDRLDAVRTGLAVGAGIGALITLALALRRQQATEHDATERRLTELYVKAVDQLGSDKAAVRHGGLYALERVAQDNPVHRQTIVDVICAYLRAPYTTPRILGTDKIGGLRTPLRPARTRLKPFPSRPNTASRDADQEAQQEREVRLTAQRILRDHLQPRIPDRTWVRRFPRPTHTFWPGIDLDLSGATLIDFNLYRATIRNARFTRARFSGTADFIEARFDGTTDFSGAQFSGGAWFSWAQFNGTDWLSSGPQFSGAQFSDDARFSDAKFSGTAWFDGAKFSGTAWFDRAQFRGTHFGEVQFGGDVRLVGVQFGGTVPNEIKRYL